MMLMAVAAVASCEKYPVAIDEPEASKGSYIYTINASVPEETDVKSDYDASGNFSWSSGDAISVLFHKGDDNKFFILETTGTGASAAFSGAIEDGYEIGASDGTDADKKIWALFPASGSHEYTPGSNPTFYVRPSVDFSATYFSANVPMCALNAAEGSLTFENIACTYKFIVSGIQNGVSKVRFTIYNQTTYALSGSWPISGTSDKYIDYNYASPGSAKSTLSYVSNVVSNQAVFYVSCRYWGKFQPVITITNETTGIVIKSFNASKEIQPTSKTSVKPITLDVSDGNFFTPAINIDGDMSDWDPSTNDALTDGVNFITVTSSGNYKQFSVAYDSRNIYFYSKRNYNEALWTDDGYYYFYFDWGNTGTEELVFYLRPFTKGSIGTFTAAPGSNITTNDVGISSFTTSCAGSYDASIIETEITISLSDLGIKEHDVIKFASSGNKSASKITMGANLEF